MLGCWDERVHRITYSAEDRISGGMLRLRARAVLRLMISLYVIGCSTDISAGWAPVKTLVTWMHELKPATTKHVQSILDELARLY